MMYPLVRELAAEGIPVAVTCRVLNFSRQAFYQWRRNPVSDRDWDEAQLINAAVDVHADDPEFGYRLIADELHELGHKATTTRIGTLCSQHGIRSVIVKQKGKQRRPGPAVHDDLVKRKFTADQLNALWLVDITEHRTDEGKLYLCAIKDACSNKIVGYSIADNMRARLAVSALRNAAGLRSTVDCVMHSDRGSQGEFNWSSQHLDGGGVRWGVARSGCRNRRRVRGGGSGRRIGRCGRRCVRQAGLNLRGLSSVISGG